MGVSYDCFTGAFLSKITEFELSAVAEDISREIVDGYMKRSVSHFKKNCKYDLTTTADDDNRVFNVEIKKSDLDEIVDIVSEGMIVQWLKPYVYQQELLENTLNTRDFTTYSPAELLLRISNTYAKAQKDYIQMIREYSYNNNDLSGLHL